MKNNLLAASLLALSLASGMALAAGTDSAAMQEHRQKLQQQAQQAAETEGHGSDAHVQALQKQVQELEAMVDELSTEEKAENAKSDM
ncbi:hypothetical protein FGL86_10725 [Pistricoccus aurantiacus]|uniref:Uncharacterized protein n=1 Tax=Pistricoccus aurantiacus TaxID=1883414 RepID=A0A5B8SX56_9GAMM|nr:hypothetical protein [Pistricoccus aurantiacus]QEA39503.1 hypothetical protein FGL86_10725 [Pistricoccus aurantiacus]